MYRKNILIKLSTLILITLIVLTNLSSIAFAYVDGTAYGSNWNYYYDVENEEVDSRKAAYWCKYYCEEYDDDYAIFRTYECAANNIYTWAKNYDAIEFTSGHGGPGRIAIIEDFDNDDDWDKTYIRAGKGGESNTSDYYYLSTYSSTNIDDVALWVFAACNTANTSSTLGNLVNMATIKGVDCVIGYNDEIWWPVKNVTSSGNLFWHEFWYYAAGMGDTIRDSHDIALDNLIAWEGDAQGYDSEVISGEFGGLYYIKPAHNGF